MNYSNFLNSARQNKIEEVKQFLSEGITPDVSILNEVILYNHRDLISLFLSYDLEWNVQTLISSVISKNILLFSKVLTKVAPNDDVLREIITLQDQLFLDEISLFKGVFSSSCACLLIVNPEIQASFVSSCLDLLEQIPSQIEIDQFTYDSMSDTVRQVWNEKKVILSIVKEDTIN